MRERVIREQTSLSPIHNIQINLQNQYVRVFDDGVHQYPGQLRSIDSPQVIPEPSNGFNIESEGQYSNMDVQRFRRSQSPNVEEFVRHNGHGGSSSTIPALPPSIIQMEGHTVQQDQDGLHYHSGFDRTFVRDLENKPGCGRIISPHLSEIRRHPEQSIPTSPTFSNHYRSPSPDSAPFVSTTPVQQTNTVHSSSHINNRLSASPAGVLGRGRSLSRGHGRGRGRGRGRDKISFLAQNHSRGNSPSRTPTPPPSTFNYNESHSETRSSTPQHISTCLLYTSPSPRDQRGSRMPSSA